MTDLFTSVTAAMWVSFPMNHCSNSIYTSRHATRNGLIVLKKNIFFILHMHRDPTRGWWQGE